MERFDLIIVGGGASGLAAAIEAKRTHSDFNIAVLEQLPRIGKKLLATGNGRCNLSNTAALSHAYRNKAFAAAALNRFDVPSTLDFFESMGLLSRCDSEGRIYPASNTAASVLDAMRFEAKNLGVEIICDSRVNTAEKRADGFIINGGVFCRYLIIAAGGCAAPSQGSDGSGFKLLMSLGHRITRLMPSLVQLSGCEKFTRPLKGIRAAVSLRLECNGKEAAETEGEILFTDYGLSGIAAMEISRSFEPSQKNQLVIDFLPGISAEKAVGVLTKKIENNPRLPIEELGTGLLHKKLALEICKAVLHYKPSDFVSIMKQDDIISLVNSMKSFRLDISGLKGFNDAQVTRGGADISEFNPLSMQSCKVKGLYCCGEVLDVDGGCGGYNLQWAWSSGRLAGRLEG